MNRIYCFVAAALLMSSSAIAQEMPSRLTFSQRPPGFGEIARIPAAGDIGLEIWNADRSLVVRIKMDGTVEFGEGVDPDAASRQFYELVGRYYLRCLTGADTGGR